MQQISGTKSTHSTTITGNESPQHPFSDNESDIESYRLNSLLRGEMKGPVCVYSSGDTEVKMKSLAESIGIASTSTKTETSESVVNAKETEIANENRTISTDSSGSCTMVSEEMAKFAVTSVQSQPTECFSASSIKTATSDMAQADDAAIEENVNEVQSGASYHRDVARGPRDEKHTEEAMEDVTCKSLEESIKRRKLSQDDIPSEFALKVSALKRHCDPVFAEDSIERSFHPAC